MFLDFNLTKKGPLGEKFVVHHLQIEVKEEKKNQAHVIRLFYNKFMQIIYLCFLYTRS